MALCATSVMVLALGACRGDGGENSPRPGPGDAGLDASPFSPPDAMPAPDATPPVAPPLRHLLTSQSDDVIAGRALALLGASRQGDLAPHSCNDCHAMTRPLLYRWRDLGAVSLNGCLTDPAVASPASAKHMLDCLRADPTDASSPFVTPRLGWYAAAAHLDWFKFVFQRAYASPAEAATRFDGFRQRVGMPKGNHTPFSQDDFDVIAEWFSRNMPYLGVYVADDPPPAGCTSSISPLVAGHAAIMKLAGWGAVNAENHMLMFGCGSAQNPRDCLASFPLAGMTSYGVGWESMPGAHLRILREDAYVSSYWTRSSPDGRFVAHGGAEFNDFDYNASIVDLQSDKVIPVNAYYDPGFFPDNSGFVFQGNQAYFCEQNVLTAGPGMLSFDEPGCTGTIDLVGLYQHVGATLGGGDYWTVDSEFATDDGGKMPTVNDPIPNFASDSPVRLNPMIHTGHSYAPGGKIAMTLPYEGDTVISPSSRLLISRLAGPDSSQRGYVLRRLVATPHAGGGYDVQTPEIARYCVKGAKPNFSFDERFIVTHHYVTDADAVDLGFSSADDPGFQPYREKGSSNIYIVDLVTGVRKRITRLQPGQYALYPHFRSDGWIYFIVRTLAESTEQIVASDAALVLAGP